MSEKISRIITDFLLRKNVIKEEEKEIAKRKFLGNEEQDDEKR